MKIYSTRHGETDYNKQGLVLGTTDLPLNETGRAQAADLAERIARLGDVEVIIASPLRRAQETAKAVAERCGLEIITDGDLREWDYGSCEGKSYSVAEFGKKKREFGVRMGESGESLLQLAHRVYSVLDRIIAQYSGRTVLIVSHGGVCRMIETYFHNMTQQEFSGWFMGNCQILEYDTEKET
ncbi:MAG: histidine phosphatase family protein [Ruminococcus sp.]|nr:histidine phosphatase family protein [Ruminococcus sp.]